MKNLTLVCSGLKSVLYQDILRQGIYAYFTQITPLLVNIYQDNYYAWKID